MSHFRIRSAAVAVVVGAFAVLLVVSEGLLPLPLTIALVCPLLVLVVVDELRPGWSEQATPGRPSDTDRSPRRVQEVP